MKISRKGKTGCALVLAALMALAGLSAKQTYAAGAVDLSKTDCSIKISVAIGRNGTSNEKYEKDFNAMGIPVNLYRVADVDVTGQKYTTVKPFENVDLSGISSGTTADEWLEMAAQAAKEENLKAASPIRQVTQAGETTFENLTPGMYLVAPEDSYNPDYTVQYTFTPYLTALPSSAYAIQYDADGNPIQDTANSDDWDYHTTVGLKPEAEPQFGQLKINKILDNFNETLGKATFVFQVEGRDEDGNLAYSEVVSTTHESLATETVVLDQIPAGIRVSVEEVYSGASYETVGNKVWSDILIWSDAAVDHAAGGTVNGEVIQTAEVSFQNRYDGGNRGGYGVTNEFTNGGDGWEWTSESKVPGLEELEN